MAQTIFITAFLGVYGFAIGKTFKRLNPFLMLFGMLFSLPLVQMANQYDQPLVYIPFIIGFFANFTNPMRRVLEFFSEIKMSFQMFLNRRRFKKAKTRKFHEEQQQSHQQSRQSSQQRNRSSSSESYYRKQAEEERERLRREAEELRRRQEQFQREQAQARQQQSSTPNDELNPKNFNDACEILGCQPTDDLATFKKAYRVLRAMYHPDKVEQFGGRRKKQAEAEMKLINLAWETIQKRFR